MLIEEMIIKKKYCEKWIDDTEIKKIQTIREKVLIETFLGKVLILINYFLVRKMVYVTGEQFIPNFPIEADKYVVVVTWTAFSFIVLISIFQIITRNKVYTSDETLSEESVMYYKYKLFARVIRIGLTTIFYVIIYQVFFQLTINGIDIKSTILWWIIVFNLLVMISLIIINSKDYIKLDMINTSMEEIIDVLEKGDVSKAHLKVKEHAATTEIRSFDFEITYKAIENLLYVAELVAEKETKSLLSKTELITNVSHDLKTPLTSIINYVDFLSSKELNNEKKVEYIKILERKTNRLKILIDDLKEATGSVETAIKLEQIEVNLQDILNQALLECKEKIQNSNLEFEVIIGEKQGDLKTAFVDYNKTLRVFQNLISNILKYSKKDSKVIIKLEQEESVEFERGYYTRITFRNVFEEEIKETANELMERFRRGDTSRNTEGSGLGLDIAKTLIQLQGGDIKVNIDEYLFIVDVVI